MRECHKVFVPASSSFMSEVIMRRTFLLVILLVTLLNIITGCDSNHPSDTSISAQSDSSVSLDSATHNIRESDYRIAAKPDVITRGSSSENGFYQVLPHNGHSNLMFIDYATAQQVYLCSSPSCDHSSNMCSSYIESNGYAVFPAVYNDTVLLIYNSMGNQASRIEKMDADGANREVLYTFSGNTRIKDGAIVGDGKLILCATKLIPNAEKIDVVQCLLSIQISTGDCSELYQVRAEAGETQKSLFIRGVSDSGFILKTISVKESNDIGLNSESVTIHRIFELSFDGNKEKELLTYNGASCFEEYNGQQLVYLRFDSETGCCSLHKISNATGEDETIIDDINSVTNIRKTAMPLSADNFSIVDFIDNYVLINHLFQEGYDEHRNIELLYTQYAVNLETGELFEITLSNYHMATRKPINIIAHTSDYLLVDAIEEMINGVAYRRPGLIRIDDYLHSNGEYIMIKQVLEESLG